MNKKNMMNAHMTRKLSALLCAGVCLAACTACGGESSEVPAETTSAPETTATTAETAETAEAVTTEAVELEEKKAAESGEAFLYINDGQFWVSYDGTDKKILSYAPGVPKITGDGEYTVSVDCGTKGAQYEISNGTDPNGDYHCGGLAFAAVIVKDGTTLFPGMSIEITEIRVDGKAITPVAKNYTSSDDGKEMRANIYNEWVDHFPDDAHTAEGAVTGDFGEYSSQIVSLDDFSSWQKVEVDFKVTGTDGAAPAEGEEAAETEVAETEAAEAETEAAETTAEAEEAE